MENPERQAIQDRTNILMPQAIEKPFVFLLSLPVDGWALGLNRSLGFQYYTTAEKMMFWLHFFFLQLRLEKTYKITESNF